MGEYAHHAPFGGGELGWALISTALALVVVLVSSRVVGAARVVPATSLSILPGWVQHVLCWD